MRRVLPQACHFGIRQMPHHLGGRPQTQGIGWNLLALGHERTRANQTIVAVTISAVAEATLLAQQGGADPTALRAALKGGFADSIILQQHGERMSDGNFAPGGLSKFQLKDLDNTLEEARSLGVELPSTRSVRDRFEYLIDEMDGAELDHSALYLELKKRNGML